VSFLSIIRFFTVAVSLLYSTYTAPWSDIAMFFDRGLSIIGEGGHSALVNAGTIGIYITAVASVVVAFLGIPRWRAGTRALSWCFLIMGLSLLTRLVPAYWDRLLPWHIQVTSYVVPLIFALPPFILAVMLRQPLIEAELQRTR
jgi:hypothetical protein